jgi:hypothetical protein
VAERREKFGRKLWLAPRTRKSREGTVVSKVLESSDVVWLRLYIYTSNVQISTRELGQCDSNPASKYIVFIHSFGESHLQRVGYRASS